MLMHSFNVRLVLQMAQEIKLFLRGLIFYYLQWQFLVLVVSMKYKIDLH